MPLDGEMTTTTSRVLVVGTAGTGAKPRKRPAISVTRKRRPVKSQRSGGPQGRASSRRLKQIAAKKAAILDAALDLFSQFGLRGTTVDQIADTADVSKTNLFYYFSSKEEVYIAVLQRLLDQWLAPLKAVEVDGDPVESILTYIRSKVAFSRAHPEASRLFCLEIVQGAPLLGPELRTSLKALVDAKAAVIKAWIDSGKLAPVDPYHLIFSIWATTQHYADFAVQVDALVGRSLADETFVDDTVNNIQRIILDGIRVRDPNPPGC